MQNSVLYNHNLMPIILTYLNYKDIARLENSSKLLYEQINKQQFPFWKKFKIDNRDIENITLLPSYIGWCARKVLIQDPRTVHISLCLRIDEMVWELKYELVSLLHSIFKAVLIGKSLDSLTIAIIADQDVKEEFINQIVDLLVQRDSLSKLHFVQQDIHEENSNKISQIKGLKKLNLSYCRFGDIDKFMDSLSPLEGLYLDDVDEVPMDVLANYIEQHKNKLNYLGFDAERIESSQYLQLLKPLKYLKKIKITQCVNMGDLVFKVLAQNIPTLEKISFTKAFNCDNQYINEFFQQKFNTLRYLYLTEFSYLGTDTAISISTNCPNLRILDLSWSMQVGDEGIFQILTNLLLLRKLNLVGLKKITDKPLVKASKLDMNAYKSLKKVNLTQCNKVEDKFLRLIIKKYPLLKIRNYYGELNDNWF